MIGVVYPVTDPTIFEAVSIDTLAAHQTVSLRLVLGEFDAEQLIVCYHPMAFIEERINSAFLSELVFTEDTGNGVLVAQLIIGFAAVLLNETVSRVLCDTKPQDNTLVFFSSAEARAPGYTVDAGQAFYP